MDNTSMASNSSSGKITEKKYDYKTISVTSQTLKRITAYKYDNSFKNHDDLVNFLLDLAEKNKKS